MTKPHPRGISTIEILVGVMLSLLILGVLYSFQRWQYQAFARQSVYVESQNLTRNVIDAITRDLRMAAFDPLAAALPAAGPCCPGNRRGIIEAGVDRLRFQQDLNGDGDVADDGEDVTYAIAVDAITRTDAGTTTELATNIPADGLAFRYFDGSNPPVEFVPAGTPAELNQCQRDCVAKVQVAVRSAIPGPDPMNPVAVRSQAASEVAIRNRSLDNF
jgi:Tfp pilus assembly protein PilW